METPRPRHVLFLTARDTRNPEGGGSEVYVERMAAEMVARGHYATIVCAEHAQAPRRETKASGVRMLRRGGRHTVYLRAALLYLAGFFGIGALARGRRGRPDVIVDICNGVPFLSVLYARRPVIALVHHPHREQWHVVLPGWRAHFGWWIESRLAIWAYRRCPYVTVSEATRSELVQMGVDRDRITIVHNGTPELVGEPVDRASEPELLILGRLVPHKRIEVALRVTATLAAEFPGLRLVVAGQGWWEPQLRESARELGLADRVRFTGFVPERVKHELLCSAWVALMPSVKEGWGLTIVEAGAVGTPTVAFREGGGVSESIVDGVTGLLADDEAAFTAHVRLLLTDDARRREMGIAARAHAASFTWAASGERFATMVTAGAGVAAAPAAQPYLVP